MTSGQIPIRRALISVWDKSGVVAFAQRLAAAGVEIISSGGTAHELESAGLDVTRVADVTGAPEILGGRVKTLHPSIHGPILADTTDESHRVDLKQLGLRPIELVVVNLYPFEATVASGSTDREVIEQIDIGGPAMVRAAAKNHRRVGVVVDTGRYDEIASAVEAGGLDDELRRDLAREAFFRTAAYDAAIVGWLEGADEPPARIVMALEHVAALRYGENPHQAGAAYAVAGTVPWWRDADQIQGKEMSFNNYLDTEAAWRLANDFDDPAAAIVKHANPCGAAIRGAIADAFTAAWECDPLSAFGGVVALNRELDHQTAVRIAEAGFVEVVVVPAVDASAADVFSSKSNLRLLVARKPGSHDPDLRRLEDGVLMQDRDSFGGGDREVVSRRPPTDEESRDLEFAWKVAARTKSNAIVVALGGSAVGVGAGDQSRIGAAEKAIAKAGDRSRGAVAASDAFLPFRDAMDTMALAGISAVIQPGGSIRDDEVIAAADDHGIALVFTRRRHFLH